METRLPQTGWILSTELAEAIGCSAETIGDWIQKYNLPGTTVGSKTFIHLEAFYNALEALGAQQMAERTGGPQQAPEKPTRARKDRKP